MLTTYNTKLNKNNIFLLLNNRIKLMKEFNMNLYFNSQNSKKKKKKIYAT